MFLRGRFFPTLAALFLFAPAVHAKDYPLRPWRMRNKSGTAWDYRRCRHRFHGMVTPWARGQKLGKKRPPAQ
jgi:hypothetical protein